MLSYVWSPSKYEMKHAHWEILGRNRYGPRQIWSDVDVDMDSDKDMDTNVDIDYLTFT